MLGIGFFEIVIIALVCFIAIGPKQLPAVMRTIAQFYRQFTSLREELRFQIMSVDDVSATKKTSEEKPKPVENKQDDIMIIPRDQNHG